MDILLYALTGVLIAVCVLLIGNVVKLAKAKKAPKSGRK